MTDNRSVTAIYPLSPVQQGMLFHAVAAPDSDVYFEQVSAEIVGKLDAASFRRAWDEVTGRHAVLRSGFIWDGGEEPFQVVYRSATLAWTELDWRGLSHGEQRHQLGLFLEADRRRGFNMKHPPLMRFALIHTGDESAFFIWSHHHIILDGWSGSLVEREVLALYTARSQGTGCALAAPRPFEDYIAWLKHQRLDEASEFWHRRLSGFVAPTRLPLDGWSVPESTVDGHGVQRLELSRALTAAIRTTARQRRLTVATIAEAAWALLLCRYSGDRDIVFGETINGRPPELVGSDSMVGVFMNTVPVRTRVPAGGLLDDWLGRVQQEQSAARQFAYAHLVDIKVCSEIDAQQPLFESVFVFESRPPRAPDAEYEPVLQVLNVEAFSRTNYPLTVVVAPGESLRLLVSYDTRRFDARGASRILEHLAFLLETIAGAEGSQIEDLPSVPTWERVPTRAPHNASHLREACIHELFEAQASRTPSAPALIMGDLCITYEELNSRANAFAQHLHGLGVGPEVVVGVCVDRSPDLLVALLAILKAGGSYLALDPNYPRRRLATMLRDSGVRVLIAQETMRGRFPEHEGITVELSSQHDSADRPPATEVDSDNLAYLMFTSGSAGRPKGVMISHRALVNRVQSLSSRFGLNPDHRVLQFISPSFDASVEEIFPALTSGAALVLHENPAGLTPDELLLVCATHGVTMLHLPLVAWREIVRAVDGDLEFPPSVDLVVVGGESPSTDEAKDWARRVGPRVRFVNAYGPTETTVTATLHEVTPGSLQGLDIGRVPIGLPLSNTDVWLLDDRGNPVPHGGRGQICIGGDSLARGYVGRPDLTAELFVPDAFSEVPGQRVYVSGDLARHRNDGNLEFVGRVDDQVKIRGWRMEPQEIEWALEQHPAVTRAGVVCHEDSTGGKDLVAYLEVPCTPAPAEESFRESMCGHVPDALVPSTFVILSELPRMPNGKLDRQALTRLPRRHPDRAPRPQMLPRNAIEQAVADVWSDVLGVPCLNVHDGFFALGGNSLLAMRVVARMRKGLDADVRLGEFLASPTVAQLAELVERARSAPVARQSSITPLQRTDGIPLSCGQESLWRLDAMMPPHHAFTMSYTALLTGPMDERCLREAVTRVTHRHDILRTTFYSGDAHPAQRVARDVPPFFAATDLSSLTLAAATTEAVRLLSKQAVLPFDLASGPLLRVTLIVLAPHRHLLAVTMHHIISDGWSMGVFLDDVVREYRAVRDGFPPSPRPAIQYGDFAAWQRNALADGRLDAQLAYWRTTLAGDLEALALPTDMPRNARPTFITAAESILLPEDVVAELRRLTRREGVTMFMIALASLYALLHHVAGAKDIRVGTLTAGRLPGTEELIGLFLNTLVLRNRLSADLTFRELLTTSRDVALQAYTCQDVPFEQVLAGLQQSSVASVALFDVMLVMQAASPEAVTFPGVDVRPVYGHKVEDRTFTPTVCDVVFVVSDTPSGVSITAKYKSELFNKSTIDAMLNRYQDILFRMASDRESRVDTLEVRTK